MSPDRGNRDVRRAIVVLPNAFTLGNLFFGVYAIVAASRGDLFQAGWYVVLGGVWDALDGRIARATHTGSRFGEELDSLVDAISFGLAPGLIMYFAVLNRAGWDWIWVFLFAACAVIRLARFNVEQAGTKKTHFHGLPTPAAGLTLATYYMFSQTPWYTETAIGDLPWHVVLRFVMALLGLLMISDVPYPAVPTVNFRSNRGRLGALIILGAVLGLIFLPTHFFFPVLLSYVAYGVIKYFIVGVMEQESGDDVLMEEEDDVGGIRSVPLGDPEPRSRPQQGTEDAPRRRRRKRRRSPATRDIPPEDSSS